MYLHYEEKGVNVKADLKTSLTCCMSSGPTPSPGIMVTVWRPPYEAFGN